MKSKGFTLIELLAVIVILAIIALIATPMVLGVIDKVKEGAAEVSAEGYLNAVEKYIVMQDLKDYKIKLENNTTYKIYEDTEYEIAFLDKIVEKVKADGVSNEIFLNDIINIKGDYPSDGYVKIGNKKIESATLSVNGYSVECDKNIKCEAVYKLDGSEIKAKSIEIDDVNIENLSIGDTVQLTATILPKNTTDKKILWKSSNEEVATITEEGLLTVVGYGTTTITARTVNNKVASKDINVSLNIGTVTNNLLNSNTENGTYTYMGGTYLKGAQTNNYVWYNGFMWRIMGKNSDGTIRLITDENVTAIPYGATDTAFNYATNEDYINDWLNEYFLGNLNSTKNIIKKGNYFCSETIGAKLTDSTVRTTCTSGSEVNANVGIISYDEYYLSGLDSSYLNIYQIFWTMTPTSSANAWFTNSNGSANYRGGVANVHGVRPVINVEANSTITEGDGTTTKYYVLVEDKKSDKTGEIGSIVTSGEYVSLEGKTYRVVSKESDGVKLILDGYYDTDIEFGSNNIFTTSTGIGQKLNGEVLIWLNLSDSSKIVNTTWYQGAAISSGFTYKKSLSKENSVQSKAGLIRVGEMLSGQSSTMLTKNYTVSSSYNNIKKNYWTMNQNTSTSNAWTVNYTGNAASASVTYAGGVFRPVIKVYNNTSITKGTGTWNRPYEI